MAKNKKPIFDALQAVRVVHALTAAADKNSTEAFLTDWRGFLASNFNLTYDQIQWLESVDEKRDTKVKDILRQTIESKGKFRLVVVMLADHTKPGGFLHELRHESVEEQRQGIQEVRANLVIARCDADCRNWRWGAG